MRTWTQTVCQGSDSKNWLTRLVKSQREATRVLARGTFASHNGCLNRMNHTSVAKPSSVENKQRDHSATCRERTEQAMTAHMHDKQTIGERNVDLGESVPEAQTRRQNECRRQQNMIKTLAMRRLLVKGTNRMCSTEKTAKPVKQRDEDAQGRPAKREIF